jgi:hypothetical protein
MPPDTLNGCEVQGWIQTEQQSGKACGIVLCYNVLEGSYVTAWYRCGDREWNQGRYGIAEMREAITDMVRRAGI